MIDATTLKRFFKERFGIPVRVHSGKHYVEARIAPNKTARFTEPLTYSFIFPVELGARVVRVVYPNHPELWQQPWCGNIGRYGIAIRREQWEAILASYESQEAVVG